MSVAWLCFFTILFLDLVVPEVVHQVLAEIQHGLSSVYWAIELEFAYWAVNCYEIVAEYPMGLVYWIHYQLT